MYTDVKPDRFPVLALSEALLPPVDRLSRQAGAGPDLRCKLSRIDPHQTRDTKGRESTAVRMPVERACIHPQQLSAFLDGHCAFSRIQNRQDIICRDVVCLHGDVEAV